MNEFILVLFDCLLPEPYKTMPHREGVIDKHLGSGYQLTKMGLTLIETDFLSIKDDEKRQRLLAMPTSFKLSAHKWTN